MSTTRRVLFRAPAKVNLTLRILGRRPDGFHELESLVVPIDLYDEFQVEAFAGGPVLECDAAELATDESNLVVRAARALGEAAGRSPDVCVRLKKRIPIGGGLGGGSSDAAGTLLAVNALWGLEWSRERLAAIGAALGSDVPFFVEGRASMIRGRGERVEPLGCDLSAWLVLIVPPYGVSTRAVYTSLRASDYTDGPWDPDSSRTRLPEVPGGTFFNDLEQAAFRVEPRLGALHARLDGRFDAAVRVSGSGSTLFAYFTTREAAEAWRERVRPELTDDVRLIVCSTAVTRTEPAVCEELHGDY